MNQVRPIKKVFHKQQCNGHSSWVGGTAFCRTHLGCLVVPTHHDPELHTDHAAMGARAWALKSLHLTQLLSETPTGGAGRRRERKGEEGEFNMGEWAGRASTKGEMEMKIASFKRVSKLWAQSPRATGLHKGDFVPETGAHGKSKGGGMPDD